MPPELNPLALFLTRSGAGIPVLLQGGATAWLAPVPAGLFPALFWTTLVLLATRSGPPKRAYRILLAYTVVATLANAWVLGRGVGTVSNLVAFLTALFAGSAVAVWLVAPLLQYHAPSFRTLPPAGGMILVGVPLGLSLLLSAKSFFPASLVLLGSVALGFLVSLQLINAGFLTRFGLSISALFTLSSLLALAESFLVAALPIAFRTLYP